MFTPVDYDFAPGKTLSDYGLEASTAFPFESVGLRKRESRERGYGQIPLL